MLDLYLLLSHELTEQQKKEAYEDLKVKNIYYLPEDLKALWSQVPPEIAEVTGHIQPIQEWLEMRVKEGDYILIQGDFGASYEMVNWAFTKKLKPLYATTRREVIESYKNGIVITNRVFDHVRFRFYKKG